MKTIYGSRLYGTETLTSDTDYRGIYIPCKEDCYLNRIQDVISVPGEDTQYFSIQKFLALASEGQSIAIEMLCSDKWEISPDLHILCELRKNRQKFFTKNMYSFIGYAKTQATKYSSRAKRSAEVEQAVNILYICRLSHVYLYEIWDILPEGENSKKTTNPRSNARDNRVYQICGRELQATITIEYAIEILEKILYSYGERIKNAKDGKIDWKSLSHAFRVAYQCEEIIDTGDLKFPLKNADYIREMKLGKFDFVNDGLEEKLNNLISSVDEKLKKSNLPEFVDKNFVDDFILSVYSSV